MCAALRARGLEPVHVPLIAFEAVRHELPAADLYVLSSATALAFTDLAGRDVAVVGEATARAAHEHGARVVLTADNLAQDLAARLAALPGRHVHVCAEVVTRPLGHACVVYRTVETAVAALPDVDVITLASGSAARHLARLGCTAPILCIGPSTATACRELGLTVAGVAHPHTSGGLAALAEQHLG